MPRTSRVFTMEDDARAFMAGLPRGSDAVLIEEKNTEDFRLRRTTAQCRTLWWKVAYEISPTPWAIARDLEWHNAL